MNTVAKAIQEVMEILADSIKTETERVMDEIYEMLGVVNCVHEEDN